MIHIRDPIKACHELLPRVLLKVSCLFFGRPRLEMMLTKSKSVHFRVCFSCLLSKLPFWCWCWHTVKIPPVSHQGWMCVCMCVCVKARTIERHFYMKSSCISQRQTLRQIELPMRPVPISAAWKYELMNKDWCFFPPTWMKVIEDEQT